ncbi:S1C family serine protease [Janibacter cremeus]|uniref:Putative serine protease PepD n=1 Tax=Janibacter cremeus TaxID=1285192 RepID=A0A852VK73_9MICO|nr:trypsin-like peptidase domain-containing protein [Janibacter cremeus]NYF97507.1 putative serine protease PepD [Janibacter cremeus]
MSSPHQGDEPTPRDDSTEPMPSSPYLPYDSIGSQDQPGEGHHQQGHYGQPGQYDQGHYGQQADQYSQPGQYDQGYGQPGQYDQGHYGQQGHYGYAQHAHQPQGYPTSPGTPPSSTGRRRGPGWFGAGALALAAALVAGAIGGIGGGLITDLRDGGGGGPTIVQRDGNPGERPEGSVAAIAADAVPSVVTIRVSGSGGSGTGSGWVYDDQGHIVTNNHVVEAAGSSGKVRIELSDGSRREAELVGRDSAYDLAVLKVDPKGLEPIAIGSSDEVVVGDEVVAVGSPLGLGSTVTAGIVSALERPVAAGESGDESYISAIQTDTAINPGNSGGPLLNGDGNVIGVNSAIAQIPGQTSTSGSIGLGFAIPSDVVVRTVDQLIETGHAKHPIIGVSLDRRWQGEGAKVIEKGDMPGDQPSVIPGSPADKAGIEPGDVIVEMDGRRISDLDQLVVRIRAEAVGDKVTLKVLRDGDERELTMTLEAAEEN